MTEMERELMGRGGVQTTCANSATVGLLDSLLSAHRGQPRSQCFARAPQFATGRRHEQLPPFGGSGGLNAGAPSAGSCDILRSHLFVKTMRTPLK